MFGGYKASKLKPQLKMAVTRFQISANKKSALMKQQIREIAKLLADDNPKEEKARIKAEALIRDDNTVEAYDILQLNCELLSERIQYISYSKECPGDLISCISTLIWASAIVDIPELLEIRKQFRYKYGKHFDSDAMQNVGGVINDRVAAKLSVQPPSAYLVQTYLEKIADEHEVDWKPKVPLRADQISEPHNNGAPAPPAPPSFGVIPEAPKSSEQQSANVPLLPTPAPPSRIDDIEEEDIFVPGAPKSPPGSINIHNRNDDGGDGGEQVNRGRTQSAGERSNGSKDNGGEDESYDDLAARFAQLNKK
mmetsp:Transcript_2509/g.5329  ORF Transcript_2509/g.5329 Transcript_2509/m.5329 type:complete len:309 (+) Transcript_2509:253-1179(+)